MAIIVDNWQWTDTANTALAAAKTSITLNGAQMQNGTVRLRVTLRNDSATAAAAAISLEYGVDSTNWGAVGVIGTATGGAWFANGTASVSIPGNSSITANLDIIAHWPVPDVAVLFRVMADGAALAFNSGVTNPTLTTSTLANRPYSAAPMAASTAALGPRDLRYSAWPRLYYAQGKWWMFYTSADEPNVVIYRYRDPSTGQWIRPTTGPNLSSDMTGGRANFAFATIGGQAVMYIMASKAPSTSDAIRRGVFNATTISFESSITTSQNRGRTSHIALDDGGYLWTGGINGTSGVWIRRSVQQDTGSTATLSITWQTVITIANSGVADGNVFALVGLTSNKVLALWTNGANLRACTISGSTVSTITTVLGTCHAYDWGVARSGNYVYVVASGSSGQGGTRRLRVFDIAADAWNPGPDGGTQSAQTNSDGIAVATDGDYVYAVFTGDFGDGGTDRKVQYQRYTGPGTTGSWGPVVDVTPAAKRGNIDHVATPAQATVNEIPVLAAFGDDDIQGTSFVIEQHSIATNGPQFVAPSLTNATANAQTPTVLRGTRYLQPARLPVGAAALAPAQVQRRLAILTPPLLTTTTTKPQASAQPGVRSVQPARLQATASPRSHAVINTQRLTPALLTANSTKPQAAVQAGVRSVQPARLQAAATLLAALVQRGAVALLPPRLTANSTKYQPAVQPGVRGVQPARLQATATPALQRASTISRATASLTLAQAAAPAPAIAVGMATIRPSLHAASTTKPQPTVQPGVRGMQPTRLQVTASPANPAASRGAYALRPASLIASAASPQPTSTARRDMAASLTTASAASPQPTLRPATWPLSVARLAVAASAANPAASPGMVVLRPGSLTTSAASPQPTAQPGVRGVQPTTAQATATAATPGPLHQRVMASATTAQASADPARLRQTIRPAMTLAHCSTRVPSARSGERSIVQEDVFQPVVTLWNASIQPALHGMERLHGTAVIPAPALRRALEATAAQAMARTTPPRVRHVFPQAVDVDYPARPLLFINRARLTTTNAPRPAMTLAQALAAVPHVAASQPASQVLTASLTFAQAASQPASLRTARRRLTASLTFAQATSQPASIAASQPRSHGQVIVSDATRPASQPAANLTPATPAASGQRIRWLTKRGQAVQPTGPVAGILTGNDGVTREIVGTLTVIDGGIDWQYASADMIPGWYFVQFLDSGDRLTERVAWEVRA